MSKKRKADDDPPIRQEQDTAYCGITPLIAWRSVRWSVADTDDLPAEVVEQYLCYLLPRWYGDPESRDRAGAQQTVGHGGVWYAVTPDFFECLSDAKRFQNAFNHLKRFLSRHPGIQRLFVPMWSDNRWVLVCILWSGDFSTRTEHDPAHIWIADPVTDERRRTDVLNLVTDTFGQIRAWPPPLHLACLRMGASSPHDSGMFLLMHAELALRVSEPDGWTSPNLVTVANAHRVDVSPDAFRGRCRCLRDVFNGRGEPQGNCMIPPLPPRSSVDFVHVTAVTEVGAHWTPPRIFRAVTDADLDNLRRPGGEVSPAVVNAVLAYQCRRASRPHPPAPPSDAPAELVLERTFSRNRRCLVLTTDVLAVDDPRVHDDVKRETKDHTVVGVLVPVRARGPPLRWQLWVARCRGNQLWVADSTVNRPIAPPDALGSIVGCRSESALPIVATNLRSARQSGDVGDDDSGVWMLCNAAVLLENPRIPWINENPAELWRLPRWAPLNLPAQSPMANRARATAVRQKLYLLLRELRAARTPAEFVAAVTHHHGHTAFSV